MAIDLAAQSVNIYLNFISLHPLRRGADLGLVHWYVRSVPIADITKSTGLRFNSAARWPSHRARTQH